MKLTEALEYGREVLSVVRDEEEGGRPGRVKVTPLRSALYIPANRQDWMQKCHRYGADAVILDLEDAVQPEDRQAARGTVQSELSALRQKLRSVWVRVNSPLDEMMADLEAVVRPGLSVVQLAKVRDPETVMHLDRLLGYFEGRNGVPYGSIAINPLLETAEGLRRAYEIAVCSARVEYVGGLLSPEGDTARALHMRAMSDSLSSESLYLRSKVLLDARAAGVRYPLGGVSTDLHPEHSVLRQFAQSNRNIGYSGMLVIHPTHVAVVNEIFSPSASELTRAISILVRLRAEGKRGAIRGPDQAGMIDLAMARYAMRTLEEAEALGIDIQPARGRFSDDVS
jgi:citrate lyase subunit beta/citryl-CoA lyase